MAFFGSRRVDGSCRAVVAVSLAWALAGLACNGSLQGPEPVVREPGAEARGSVSGLATTTDGAPVAGALVQPRSLDEPSPPIPEIAILTNADGRFVWPLFAGNYELTVIAEGCQPVSQRVVVEAGKAVTVAFTLRCQAGDGSASTGS
jgi:hypothetical protein